MTTQHEDDLVTLAEVVIALLATVALIVTAYLVGMWTV